MLLIIRDNADHLRILYMHRGDRKTSLIGMFLDPGECHMSDPVFMDKKRWQSVSSEEQQKKSSIFQRADLTRS